MKKTAIFLMALVLSFSLFGCGKPENVVAAENAYKAIGEVTLESGESIGAAETAVNALTEEEKTKYSKIVEKVTQARADYDALVTEKETADLIADITAKIDSIGTVTLASSTVISEVETKLEKLSAEAKGEIKNIDKFTAAKEQLSALQKAEKQRIIAEKTPLFNVSTDKVEGITWYQPKSMPNYIDVRSYIIPYIGVRGSSTWICTRYNYTGDEWIFWKSMTIMVDGHKYYKVGDTVRDNDTEVWEYYDEALDSNIGMDDSDIQMLVAIANSKETIIRFQGNEYHYDLTVTASDKAAIKNVLALYEALTW